MGGNRAVAEAYGLAAEDLSHIVNAFPVFARKRPEYFTYLNDRISEWKDGSLRRGEAPKLRGVPAPATQAETSKAEVSPGLVTAAVSGRRTASAQFQQAAILTWVVRQLYEEGHPVSRYRAGKMVYLIERAVGLGLFQSYLKQAAGPYDPSLRYKGPEDIAVRQQHWLDTVDESHFKPGQKVGAARKYVPRYLDVAQALKVIGHFKTFQDETLGRWTTVDAVAQEIVASGLAVSSERVWERLANDPDWQHKLDRDEFSPDYIDSTLAGLRKFGFLADQQPAEGQAGNLPLF